jgi:hypothetical protein
MIKKEYYKLKELLKEIPGFLIAIFIGLCYLRFSNDYISKLWSIESFKLAGLTLIIVLLIRYLSLWFYNQKQYLIEKEEKHKSKHQFLINKLELTFEHFNEKKGLEQLRGALIKNQNINYLLEQHTDENNYYKDGLKKAINNIINQIINNLTEIESPLFRIRNHSNPEIINKHQQEIDKILVKNKILLDRIESFLYILYTMETITEYNDYVLRMQLKNKENDNE